MTDGRVLIVGGGLGGLSAAIRLAAAGKQVELFEKNERLGGKVGEHCAAGYRFDTGPSLLTMPMVLDELFETAGEASENYLSIQPVEPICRYFFPGGEQLDTFSNPDKMMAALEAFSPCSGQDYKRFFRYARRIYQTGADVFLFSAFQEWRALWRWRHLKTLFQLYRIDPMRTMHQAVSRFFKDERLVQLFDRYATYNGSDPFSAPATLNIIPYVEFGLGGYYIVGGMFRLVDALQTLAEKLGVRIHLNQSVEKIETRDGTVCGVRVNGESLPAEAVVCNGDVVETYRRLLPSEAPSRTKMESLEPSLSGLVFLWGVKKTHPGLAHHNIIFSSAYREEFEEIFEKKMPPEDPTIYVCISNKSDAEHAPPGCENWFVLLNMPYLVDGQDWPREVERLRRVVLEKLKRHGFDMAGHIGYEETYTPRYFHEKYHSNRGSIYGISSNSARSAFVRPANRSRDYQGLYFAGGSAHPAEVSPGLTVRQDGK